MVVAGQFIDYNSLKFRELFNKLFPSVCIIASRIMEDEEKGKDIAQEAFVKLWEKTDEEFQDENALQAYLYVLVKNACIDAFRKERKTFFTSLNDQENIAADHFILDEILREETHRMLNDAIKTLSKQSTQVVEMTLQGLSNIEIADKLGVSINTIKTVKKRAYVSLRKQLGNQFISILFLQLINYFG